LFLYELCLRKNDYQCDVVGSNENLGLKLVQKSASLQLDGYAYDTAFYNVNITADGKLTCKTYEGIEVRDADTLNTIKAMKDTKTTKWGEIIQLDSIMVASCCDRIKVSAEIILLDPNTLQKTKSLFKSDIIWPPTYYDLDQVLRPPFFSHGLAQFKSLVYILARREKQLVVYNLVDNKIQKFPLPGITNPGPVCILPDSTLLIGDYTENGRVSRYKVENTTLNLMWEFPHISDPTGISFDPRYELIYICTWRGPLFIISIEGKEIMQYL